MMEKQRNLNHQPRTAFNALTSELLVIKTMQMIRKTFV